MMSFKNKHIVSLDGIRGYAAIFVVVFHLFLGIDRDFIAAPSLMNTLFVSGVDLFFVLSGFLIGGIIIDKNKNKNFWKIYMLRRIGRIFPVYFLLIGSFSIAMLLLQNKLFFDDFLLADPLPVYPYFIFMQSYFQGIANSAGPFWVGITWSLSVEEQFYIILPFLAILFGRKGIVFFILFAILIAPIVRLWAFNKFGFYGGYMLFPARMDTIAIGVAIAFIVRNNKIFSFILKSKAIYLIPLIIFFLLNEKIKLGEYVLDGYFFRALFYGSLITIVVTKKNKFITYFFENRIILFFGSISYGLYMYHQLLNGLIHGIVFNRAPKIDNLDSFIIAFFVFLVAIIISSISLNFFETPIRNYFKNKSNKLSTL